MQKLYHFVAQPYLGKVAKAFRLVPSGLEMAAKRAAWGVILPPPPLDHGKVKQDLSTSNFFSQDSNWANFTIDELFSYYNLTLRSLLDKHLPVRKMTRRVDPLTPWFDADCDRAKRNVRRLERLYHRTSFMSDRMNWVEAIRAMHSLFGVKERAFWEKKIESVAGDSKKSWRAMNELTLQMARSLMGLLLRLFPGSLHRRLKLFVLLQLLLTLLSLHPVPGHALWTLSSLSPKIKFCFLSGGHQIKRLNSTPSLLGWFGNVLKFLHLSLPMFSMIAC